MRAMWKGFMSFGLVTIPVELYSGIEAQEELHFSLLHKKDEGKIHNQRVCEVCKKEVAWGDVMKGFKAGDGYVPVTDEDFEKADVARSSTIDIQDFCKADEIDPSYFERPLFLKPQRGGDKPYALLRKALEDRGVVGIAKLVIRTREQLACIRPSGDVLILEIMRYGDELRDPKELHLPSGKDLRPKEVELAGRLVDEMTGKFEIKKYKDEFKTKMKAILKAKGQGKAPEPVGEAPKPTKVADLMSLLEQSLGKHSKPAHPHRSAAKKGGRKTA